MANFINNKKTTDVLSFSIIQRAGTEGGGKTSRLANFESQSWFSPRSLFCSLICPNSPLFDFRTGNASFTPFSLGRRCQMIMIRVEQNPHRLCTATFCRNYNNFLKLESWYENWQVASVLSKVTVFLFQAGWVLSLWLVSVGGWWGVPLLTIGQQSTSNFHFFTIIRHQNHLCPPHCHYHPNPHHHYWSIRATQC